MSVNWTSTQENHVLWSVGKISASPCTVHRSIINTAVLWAGAAVLSNWTCSVTYKDRCSQISFFFFNDSSGFSHHSPTLLASVPTTMMLGEVLLAAHREVRIQHAETLFLSCSVTEHLVFLRQKKSQVNKIWLVSQVWKWQHQKCCLTHLIFFLPLHETSISCAEKIHLKIKFKYIL